MKAGAEMNDYSAVHRKVHSTQPFQNGGDLFDE